MTQVPPTPVFAESTTDEQGAKNLILARGSSSMNTECSGQVIAIDQVVTSLTMLPDARSDLVITIPFTSDRDLST